MSDLNELKQRIDAAVPCDVFDREHGGDFGDGGYDNAARHCAKVLLRVAARDPEAFKGALDRFREHPYGDDLEQLMTADERAATMEGRFGVTGYQWGWAVNAVAHLLEQEAVPNPAIVTLGPST